MCDIQDMVWIMHTNHWVMKWAVANPELQNKGGGWSSRPWRKGGPTLPPLDLPLMNTHQLERFEMAVRMSILKQVTESDWVMHINYCITSNQRVTPLKSVNLNIHQLYKPFPGSKKVRKADQEKLHENHMGVRETRSSGASKNCSTPHSGTWLVIIYMTARAASNKQVKYMKPCIAPLDILTFNIWH